ncbi:SRSO17 transposase [Kitasatospora sp. SolWspMP-SS2h]|uniref:IS701 family transposase n=1 Tax=Kitasatospora sp. SolWspMP-SS2h TaxID=1305729 RepID=UPI000DBAB513|nr:transposase [Kitasatospora sp. SolWspMP-SS2h]RAJ38349.1 SRSO17 transposase [Kitasatospora sp. SolWspMP-SS2h]
MAVAPRPTLTRPGDLPGSPDLLRALERHFTRAEPRDSALAYVRALLADPAAGNAAGVAAQAGAGSAWSTQRLLTRTVWDADLLRDSVRAYAVALLGASGAVAVLGRHETARLGTGAVATAPAAARGPGRGRSTQVAALLCYVSHGTGALIDRELHLPPHWTADPARCARAGVPPERVRPRGMADLGQEMLDRALAAGVPIGGVLGGPDFAHPHLREWLCRRRLPFCVELPQLPQPPGRSDAAAGRADSGREEVWQLLGRGLGSVYGHPAPGFRLSMLARRLPSGRTARYLLHMPAAAPDVPAAQALAAAGSTAARAVHEAASRAGLSSHQVRSWVAWYRHTTLAMTAAALLWEPGPGVRAADRGPARPAGPAD